MMAVMPLDKVLGPARAAWRLVDQSPGQGAFSLPQRQARGQAQPQQRVSLAPELLRCARCWWSAIPRRRQDQRAYRAQLSFGKLANCKDPGVWVGVWPKWFPPRKLLGCSDTYSKTALHHVA